MPTVVIPQLFPTLNLRENWSLRYHCLKTVGKPRLMVGDLCHVPALINCSGGCEVYLRAEGGPGNSQVTVPTSAVY